MIVIVLLIYNGHIPADLIHTHCSESYQSAVQNYINLSASFAKRYSPISLLNKLI
jgi:hypothetical protein